MAHAKQLKRKLTRGNNGDITEEPESVSKYGRPSVKHSVPLARATEHDLGKFGASDELLGAMTNLQGQGKVQRLSDVGVFLEKSSLPYEVHVGRKILFRLDSSEQVVIEQAAPYSGENESVFTPPRSRSANAQPRQVSSPGKGAEKVNVNSASAEALEDLNGIGPALAVKIIEFRNLHGPFTQFEEITAVRGVSKRLIRKLQPRLTLDDLEEESGRSKQEVKPAGSRAAAATFSGNPSKSVGPKYNGQDVVRVGSWNLLRLSSDKVENEGVREVVCRTILENGIGILAVQEIGDDGALEQIRDELNNPRLEAVKNCQGNSQQWECSTSDVAGYMFRSKELNGFLWDASLGIKLKSAELLEKPKGKKQFARRPFMGYFQAKKFDFILVSVHLKATGLGNEDLSRLQEEIARVPDLTEALYEHIPGEKDAIIAGDFNLSPDEEEFDSLRTSAHRNLIPSSSFTNISTKNMSGSKCYDHMWVASGTKEGYFTGRAGVIRHGLRHQAIPDGWKWNGLVSDHCPVWAEFFCDRDKDQGTGARNLAGVSIANE